MSCYDDRMLIDVHCYDGLESRLKTSFDFKKIFFRIAKTKKCPDMIMGG